MSLGIQAHPGILLSRLLNIRILQYARIVVKNQCVWWCVCLCVCVLQRDFRRKDEDKDRDRIWRQKKNTPMVHNREKAVKSGIENEMGVEMIWTRRHGWRQVSEARLCVYRRGVAATQREERQRGKSREGERERKRETECGAERQHSPHIRDSDKDLGRRVWSVDFKEMVHTLPKIRGIETDEITALSSQSAEQDQREKMNIINNNNSGSSSSINQSMRGKQETGDTTAVVLMIGLLVLWLMWKYFAVGTVRLSNELRNFMKPSSTLSHQLNI